jgi:hypothetical protein
MYSRLWQVIKDDSKRTFEVCGQASNTNAFTNQTIAWQRVGMNVSCVTLQVTDKTSSKGQIKITGYTAEEGLHDRLKAEFNEILRKGMEEHDDSEDIED